MMKMTFFSAARDRLATRANRKDKTGIFMGGSLEEGEGVVKVWMCGRR